ncbi:MAG: aspartate aminotransferase family protein [Deltaproteobacteria bacterium]|jgi:predicted acetylornithine/succinylornithine family transaminase|nr:aspartate aminotransferase family protein [Deltaproteobacteria bacterium]MBW2499761.1 aspartate aminotransferase family protein [Deltaproteobacteria bacterium]
MTSNAEIARRGQQVLVGNYAPQPIALVRGEGCWLVDAEDRRYLDLMGGIATASLGHANPRLRAALEEQAARLWHVSNLYTTEPQIRLAERLTANSFAERIYVCNSGAEANEAALKLARRYHRDKGDDRFEIIAFEGSFHGRTLFTVSATGTPAYWQGFEPLVPGIHHAAWGDLEDVRALLSERTAAILVEPIQGEGGIRMPPPGFLRGLRELADENGCLLIFDEVQTGIGRTGTLFAHEQEGATPDVMTLAKALGGGIPIGAMCTTAELASALVPGTHASTFGGNPLACAVACAVVDELLEGGVLDHAKAMGERLGEGLDRIAAEAGPSRVLETRGRGLLRGLVLNDAPGPVIDACRERGVLVISAGGNVLRLAPPLVISAEEIDQGLAVLLEVLLAS